ncbi:helix-turn-helix domain-containing protein [Microbacterium oleivorans]|uniref:helix-turn-helix domain-containing protein n=1 Tax=Microbacterium TaxID=33882 RepID=UPI0033DD0C52
MTTTDTKHDAETPALARGTLTLDDVRGRATISVDEAASVLGVSRSNAYASARRGDTFPVKRIGRRLLVPVPALIAWLGEG